jgi:hypothetical protein
MPAAGMNGMNRMIRMKSLWDWMIWMNRMIRMKSLWAWMNRMAHFGMDYFGEKIRWMTMC